MGGLKRRRGEITRQSRILVKAVLPKWCLVIIYHIGSYKQEMNLSSISATTKRILNVLRGKQFSVNENVVVIHLRKVIMVVCKSDCYYSQEMICMNSYEKQNDCCSKMKVRICIWKMIVVVNNCKKTLMIANDSILLLLCKLSIYIYIYPTNIN